MTPRLVAGVDSVRRLEGRNAQQGGYTGVRAQTHSRDHIAMRRARLLDQENGEEEVRRSMGKLEGPTVEGRRRNGMDTHVRLGQQGQGTCQ
jgi:hypothetical protein